VQNRAAICTSSDSVPGKRTPAREIVAWYNFARKHDKLKGSTPAMASELSDHVWTIKELIEKAGEA
jgi:hypothetical protein